MKYQISLLSKAQLTITTVISSRVKIWSFRGKAHLVFHWCLFNKTEYVVKMYSLTESKFNTFLQQRIEHWRNPNESYNYIPETDDILLSKILTFHHFSLLEEYGFRLVSAEFCIIAGEEVLEEKKRKLCLSKIPLEMQFFFAAKL